MLTAAMIPSGATIETISAPTSQRRPIIPGSIRYSRGERAANSSAPVQVRLAFGLRHAQLIIDVAEEPTAAGLQECAAGDSCRRSAVRALDRRGSRRDQLLHRDGLGPYLDAERRQRR